VVSAVIVVVSTRPMRPWIAVSLGLILGGALGNLADRVANGPSFSGRVTDFIDLQVWPIFNLADTAIVLGAAILAVASFDGTDDHVEPSGASGPAAETVTCWPLVAPRPITPSTLLASAVRPSAVTDTAEANRPAATASAPAGRACRSPTRVICCS